MKCSPLGSCQGIHLLYQKFALRQCEPAGITSGVEGFDNLLNLDGVDGVFGQAPVAENRPNKHLSINLSLLDEDGDDELDSNGRSFDLTSWGLGLPSVSEAASSVQSAISTCSLRNVSAQCYVFCNRSLTAGS